jgi:hypothetical protein
MTLMPPDGRRNKVQLDISETEALEFASGDGDQRRGRKPGSKTK